jgi:hypothetical protein
MRCIPTRGPRPTPDWPQIVALYNQLLVYAPTPVVALNRAVAALRPATWPPRSRPSSSSTSTASTSITPRAPTSRPGGTHERRDRRLRYRDPPREQQRRTGLSRTEPNRDHALAAAVSLTATTTAVRAGSSRRRLRASAVARRRGAGTRVAEARPVRRRPRRAGVDAGCLCCYGSGVLESRGVRGPDVAC